MLNTRRLTPTECCIVIARARIVYGVMTERAMDSRFGRPHNSRHKRQDAVLGC